MKEKRHHTLGSREQKGGCQRLVAGDIQAVPFKGINLQLVDKYVMLKSEGINSKKG